MSALPERVRCFLLEETNRGYLGLRRYRSSDGEKCPAGLGYHNAITYIGEIPFIKSEPDEHGRRHWVETNKPDIPHDDPRWPTVCSACGAPFVITDAWQIWTEAVYRRSDTGADATLRDAPPGAMWNAWWMADLPTYRGDDGQSLIVKCPDSYDWAIDAIASNCDAPCLSCGQPLHLHLAQNPTISCRQLNPKPHKCWVRHGQAPNITVDKNGVTCSAGAGSIQTPGYHGFLRNGVFEP